MMHHRQHGDGRHRRKLHPGLRRLSFAAVFLLLPAVASCTLPEQKAVADVKRDLDEFRQEQSVAKKETQAFRQNTAKQLNQIMEYNLPAWSIVACVAMGSAVMVAALIIITRRQTHELCTQVATHRLNGR